MRRHRLRRRRRPRVPANPEICDDAGHDEDCDPTTVGTRDLDRDTFTDARCCNTAPGGASTCGRDCDDSRAAISPVAPETCDGLDDDCDTSVDEGVQLAVFVDADRDLHGDPSRPIMACPGAAGVSTVSDDCDDTSVAVHGAQLEVCDGVDNDCNGVIDDHTGPATWYADQDGDGFGSAASGTTSSCVPVAGSVLIGSDCDDTVRARSPLASERCNGLDDDCNGLADYAIGPSDLEDDDADGHPDIRCGGFGTDCDDLDAAAHPDAIEICDGRDDDCDMLVDEDTAATSWYVDRDGDGFGDALAPTMSSCTPLPARTSIAGDCDDSDPARRPGVADACDGVDDDCDAMIDEDVPRTAFYADVDGDGAGSGPPILACVAPPGDVVRPGDCADAASAVGPLVDEACNGLDDDCDTMIDENALVDFYPDLDGDGHGAGTTPMTGCAAPSGYAPGNDDCDDADPLRAPMRVELCDGVDQDCDTTIDESAGAACVVTNATGACVSGACTVGSCRTGFGDCDGRTDDGCEADLSSSASACGSCATACGTGGSCIASTCDDVIQIDAASNFACALRAGGRVVCWGDNTNGQLGFTGAGVPVPVRIAGITGALEVAASGPAACARLPGGAIWCWGGGNEGELGNGASVSSTTPVRVIDGTGSPVADAIRLVGDNTSGAFCAIRSAGTVSCWGANVSSGELGDGTRANRNVATPVVGMRDAIEIAAGDQAFLVRTSTGRVLGWGGDAAGALGDGMNSCCQTVPVDLTTTLPAVAVQVAMGGLFGCARFGDGTSWCWGSNGVGALGRGNTTSTGFGGELPGPAPLLTGADELVAGASTLCGRFGGVLRCLGGNTSGMLGAGLAAASSVTLVDVVGITDARTLSVGGTFACAIRTSVPTVLCWGGGGSGQLGNGSTLAQNHPVFVVF